MTPATKTLGDTSGAGADAGVVRRALGLKKEGIFNLLLVLTTLLGWVMALGGGGAVLLQQAWRVWSLDRAQQVTVYLPPASAPVAIDTLAATLATEPGIGRVTRVPEADLRAQLALFGADQSSPSLTLALPLPVVLEVQTDPGFDRRVLTQRVRQAFASAEIDDARAVLAPIAAGVRVAQGGAAVLALVMVAVMLGLVGMTVRIGLRSQKATLHLLRQLGAGDRQLVRLVAGQVAARVLPGWVFSCLAAELTAVLVLRLVPAVQPLAGWPVALAMAAVSLVLPISTILFAGVIAQRQLWKMV